jgi:orotate phosphoribosyltransferase-like protein
MAKLSKANFYAIQWLNSQGKSSTEIAQELNISQKQVESNITPQAEQSTDASKITPKNLMITQTSGKGTNTVAIMTKQASELGDELKKNHVPPRSNVGIFRPRQ